MLTRRVIVCLDVDRGRVVKGTRFVALRDVGDPVELAMRYEADGADEICFLDISASIEQRDTMLEVARRAARRLFIPLTIGGGIRSVEDVASALRAGADKVAINSAAIARPSLLDESAERFGTQCVVASMDARRRDGDPSFFEVYSHGGRSPTGRDAVEWARECVQLGAGEILVTSMDRDGERGGYDIQLTRAVADAVAVPVVASGGAGNAAHVRDALTDGGADAALVAGILHDGVTTVRAIKDVLRREGILVRGVEDTGINPGSAA